MTVETALAVVLRPLFVLVLAMLVLVPARNLVRRKMKEGKLKRFLLFRVGP